MVVETVSRDQSSSPPSDLPEDTIPISLFTYLSQPTEQWGESQGVRPLLGDLLK